jgi:hypothetical protein
VGGGLRVVGKRGTLYTGSEMKIPTFEELPIREDLPADCSWGVFGDNDALGCLNFLTPQGVVDGAGLVKSGKVFRLDARMGFAKPPLFGRPAPEHTVVALAPMANDDIVHFNTQESSQWDGLGHVGHVRHQRFYGNVTIEEVRGGNAKLGIHHWANKFVGRGLLIDAFGYRKAKGRPVNALDREVYTLADLKAAIEHQGSPLKPGTILLVRTGWMESYEKLTADEKRVNAPMDKLRSAQAAIGGHRGQPRDGGVAVEQSRGGDRHGLPVGGSISLRLHGRRHPALSSAAAIGTAAGRAIRAGAFGRRLRAGWAV